MAIQINVSERAAEKPRQRGELPLGWYHLRCTGVELRESQSEKNSGKPMYNFEWEITDDERNPQNEDGASEYAGRPEWINACLWEGAEFTIVGIMNALGHDIQPGKLDVPDITDPDDPQGGLDAFLGKELMAFWGVKKKEKIAAAKEKRKPDAEWLRFRSADEDDDAGVAAATPAVRVTGGRTRRALA